MAKKIIKMQYEVIAPEGKCFTTNENIKRMIRDIYEEYIREQGCSDIQVKVISIEGEEE